MQQNEVTEYFNGVDCCMHIISNKILHKHKYVIMHIQNIRHANGIKEKYVSVILFLLSTTPFKHTRYLF